MPAAQGPTGSGCSVSLLGQGQAADVLCTRRMRAQASCLTSQGPGVLSQIAGSERCACPAWRSQDVELKGPLPQDLTHESPLAQRLWVPEWVLLPCEAGPVRRKRRRPAVCTKSSGVLVLCRQELTQAAQLPEETR